MGTYGRIGGEGKEEKEGRKGIREGEGSKEWEGKMGVDGCKE